MLKFANLYTNRSLAAPPLVFTKASDPDMVIYCGSPGCGKSTFFWKHLKPLGYERVNQDILKSRDRCIKVASEHLTNGNSVLIGMCELQNFIAETNTL
jgi:bifunctional polynucleotide phosphatase/kinase